MGSSKPDSEVLVKVSSAVTYKGILKGSFERETRKHEGPSAKRETGFHIFGVPNETRPRILALVMVILATGRERPDSGAPLLSHSPPFRRRNSQTNVRDLRVSTIRGIPIISGIYLCVCRVGGTQ